MKIEPYIELDGYYTRCPKCWIEIMPDMDCPNCLQEIDWSWLHLHSEDKINDKKE